MLGKLRHSQPLERLTFLPRKGFCSARRAWSFFPLQILHGWLCCAVLPAASHWCSSPTGSAWETHVQQRFSATMEPAEPLHRQTSTNPQSCTQNLCFQCNQPPIYYSHQMNFRGMDLAHTWNVLGFSCTGHCYSTCPAQGIVDPQFSSQICLCFW